MKLLREMITTPLQISEGGEDKNLHVSGIFLQGDIKNRNGRRYPIGVLQNEAKRYTESAIANGRAWGELGHPDGPTINLDRICFRIKDLRQEGSNFLGKAMITPTPMGQVLEGLIKSGGNIGVSSRAMGTLKEGRDGVMEVQDDLTLSAIDAVADPSAPEAWVKGVMESAEWTYDETNGWRVAQAAEDSKREMSRLTTRQIQEGKVAAFEKFLKSLSS